MSTIFYRVGWLGTTATAIDGAPLLALIGGVLPVGIRSELERRAFREPWARDHLRTHPGKELCRLASQRLGLKRLWSGERAPFGVDAVFKDFDKWMSEGVKKFTLVYAYEDGALATFYRAKALGIYRVYDLPIAYWQTLRRLITEEADRLPDWAGTLGGGLCDSQAKLARKTRELELADLVVTPSRFVADSLPEWARGKRVVMSPFGSPSAPDAETVRRAEQARDERRRAGRPLRVLFAGSMGQRKGLGDLMVAVRLLDRADIELVVMGSLQASAEFYQRQCPGFIHEAGRPHAQVLELMRSCDVFCLPSIVEGRALVMQEAMSQGLPVILTPNTGGEDLVDAIDQIHGGGEAATVTGSARPVASGDLPSTDHRPPCADGVARRGATGFLVPIRSPEKIAEALAWFADHREAIPEMGRAAQAKAATYTWEAYGERIVEAIRGVIAAKG